MQQSRKWWIRGLSVMAALAATMYVMAGYTYQWQQTGSDAGYTTSTTPSNGRTYVDFTDQGPAVFLTNYTCGWSNTVPNYHDHYTVGPFGFYNNVRYWDSNDYHTGRILIQDVNSSTGYAEAGVYN
jgi:hypothetical protein